MNRAIGSKTNLWDFSIPEVAEFRSYIDDIWESDMVRKLNNFEQHHKTSRLQHCLSVSYYSFKIAKKIGADPRMAARAGLLHDLYWYDWHTKKTPQFHAVFHARLAARNASKLIDISEREEDAILKHMWPLYPGMPKYKESYAVTLADKYAATLEVATQWSKTLGSASARTAKRSYTRVRAAFRR
ncbi:MAG: HD domain-containing protein [Clostridia bacterium]|nr:HD domain-containing protein [Clostridia bacterium]